jgi:DNA-binding NtrC family response regulator
MAPPFDLAIVVDDDPDIALAARLALRELFRDVRAVASPADLLDGYDATPPDLILLDLNFERGATDGAEGLAWLNRIVAHDPDAAIVVITAHGGVAIAVDAIKRGASDFVSKPWSNERLASTARSAAALRRSRRETNVEAGRATEIGGIGAITPLLGDSPPMRALRSVIARVAPTEANVLILGENGTGKELVAREIHALSRRSAKPLVSVDLGAVSENLFESELFGHTKGAFTDAKASRIGRLKAADGSTLFLDEVGNLPLHLQPKILTALEQRQVVPVGGSAVVPIDIRVVAATNRPLDLLHDESLFRQDLLFRLNTVEIELPPLRKRRDDIAPLLDHYLGYYARKYAREQRPVADDAMEVLRAYDWPGNVRALRHAAERAVILANGNSFTLEDFPLPKTAARLELDLPSNEDLNLERHERQMVERALRRHHFNISSAAADLGLSRAALYRRMEKYGL